MFKLNLSRTGDQTGERLPTEILKKATNQPNPANPTSPKPGFLAGTGLDY